MKAKNILLSIVGTVITCATSAQVINMDNSPYNASSTNGVYDNTGNRIGYEVKAPSGVTNYFDNSGNRIGYTPNNR